MTLKKGDTVYDEETKEELFTILTDNPSVDPKSITKKDLRLDADDHGGRPPNQTYINNRPQYYKLATEHFKNGGAIDTFNGYVFDYYYNKYKNHADRTGKAMENTPSREYFYDMLEPGSSSYDPKFLQVVKKYSSVRDYFWKHKAVLAPKGVDSRKYQLYMANNYGWRLRQDVTSGDEKIQGPTIYRPEKRPIIDGEVVEDDENVKKIDATGKGENEVESSVEYKKLDKPK